MCRVPKVRDLILAIHLIVKIWSCDKDIYQYSFITWSHILLVTVHSEKQTVHSEPSPRRCTESFSWMIWSCRSLVASRCAGGSDIEHIYADQESGLITVLKARGTLEAMEASPGELGRERSRGPFEACITVLTLISMEASLSIWLMGVNLPSCCCLLSGDGQPTNMHQLIGIK